MVVKRLLDLFLCCLIVPMALPLVAACALLVRLSSPGPIFFRQKRIGMNRQLFEMLKFRRCTLIRQTLGTATGRLSTRRMIIE